MGLDGVSLILPCYNEVESVPALSATLRQFKDSHPHFQFETIVVDDGSEDGTWSALRDAHSFDKIISHKKNLGYGAAIKTGLHHASFPLVAFMDFDGTCNPSDLPALTRRLVDDRADMVLGLRLHGHSEMPRTRRIGNHLYAWALKFLFLRMQLPKDVCTGFRVLTNTCAQDLFQKLPDDLSFSPALTAYSLRSGYVLTQQPIQYVERLGRSKLSIVRDGFKFLFTLVRFARGPA